MTFAPSASKSQLPQRGDVVWTNTATIKGSSPTINGWQVGFIQVYIQVVCDCFVLEELAEWVNHGTLVACDPNHCFYVLK